MSEGLSKPDERFELIGIMTDALMKAVRGGEVNHALGFYTIIKDLCNKEGITLFYPEKIENTIPFINKYVVSKKIKERAVYLLKVFTLS